MAVIELTNENIDKILKQENLVIDFWAEWCGPCKEYMPIYEKIANEIEGCSFCKVNVDKCSDIASRFQVFAVPTTLFIKNGKEVSRLVGLQSAERLKKEVNQLLNK